MRDPLGKKVKEIQPSGIRKFFDIVSEMEDVIRPGISVMREFMPWKRGKPSIPQIPG